MIILVDTTWYMGIEKKLKIEVCEIGVLDSSRSAMANELKWLTRQKTIGEGFRQHLQVQHQRPQKITGKEPYGILKPKS